MGFEAEALGVWGFEGGVGSGFSGVAGMRALCLIQGLGFGVQGLGFRVRGGWRQHLGVGGASVFGLRDFRPLLQNQRSEVPGG